MDIHSQGTVRGRASTPQLRYAFGGLPKIPFAEQWDSLLASREFGRVSLAAGLSRCSPEAAHAVAKSFLSYLWNERGLYLYESRVGDEDKEGTRAIAAGVMSEVVRKASVKDIEQYAAQRRRSAPDTVEAEDAVLRGILLPLMTGTRSGIEQAARRTSLALEDRPQSRLPGREEVTLQDLSVEGAPRFYAQWCKHVERVVASGDSAAWVMSGRAGIARRFLEHCVAAARQGLSQSGRKVSATELSREVERRVCVDAGESLTSFLEPLRDGFKDQRYHTYRMALLQHFYPWLRENGLTHYDSAYDALFMPVQAPVGGWWEKLFRSLSNMVEGTEPSIQGDEPFSREVAVRVARHARGFVQFHAKRIGLSEGDDFPEHLEKLQQAMFSDPRSAIKDFLAERHPSSEHHRRLGWADLNLHMMRIVKEAGLTTYDGKAQYFVPPDVEVVSQFSSWWGAEVAKDVFEAGTLPQRTGAVRARTVSEFLERLWRSDEARDLVVGIDASGREAASTTVLKLLLEDDVVSRVWDFSEQVKKETGSERLGTAAYKLLRDEFLKRASEQGLLASVDFDWFEFVMRAEPLALPVYVSWLRNCYEGRRDGSLTTSQAGHRVRAVHGFLQHVLRNSAEPKRAEEILDTLLEYLPLLRTSFEDAQAKTLSAGDLKINVRPALQAFQVWFENNGAYQDHAVQIPRVARQYLSSVPNVASETLASPLVHSEPGSEVQSGSAGDVNLSPPPQDAVRAIRDLGLQRTSRALFARMESELGIEAVVLSGLRMADVVVGTNQQGVVVYGEQCGEYLARRLTGDLLRDVAAYLQELAALSPAWSSDPERAFWAHSVV